MTSTFDSRVVNLAGLVQGLVLVTFPAEGISFTSASRYALSSAQYGDMFLPAALTAIAGALIGALLGRRTATKTIYLAGLTFSLASMMLLGASVFVDTDKAVCYPLLLAATAFLGVGFGLTVPALIRYASILHPLAVDRAELNLTALVGLGMVLGAVLGGLLAGGGLWWIMQALSAALVVALLSASVRLPTSDGPMRFRERPHAIPMRSRLYLVFVLLLGICVAMHVDWSRLGLPKSGEFGAGGVPPTLGAFWGGAVILGRVLFAGLDRWPRARAAYSILPFVLVSGVIVAGLLTHSDALAWFSIYLLSALACAAFLPLGRAGEPGMTAVTVAVTGGIIGFYLVGYGLAAPSLHMLQHNLGMSLRVIFAATVLVALMMAFLSSGVVLRRSGLPDRQDAGSAGGPGTSGTLAGQQTPDGVLDADSTSEVWGASLRLMGCRCPAGLRGKGQGSCT